MYVKDIRRNEKYLNIMSGVTVRISKAAVNATSLDSMADYLNWNPPGREFLLREPGQEHFKLLAYLSKSIAQNKPSPLFIDAGTLYGASALALASGHPSAQVITYDIINLLPNPQDPQSVKSIDSLPNIRRKVMSVQLDIDEIAKADLVFWDIDPRTGTEETKMLKRLQEANFKGLMVVNGIRANEHMETFWKSVVLDKYDVSSLGHNLGTGIIVFQPDAYTVRV